MDITEEKRAMLIKEFAIDYMQKEVGIDASKLGLENEWNTIHIEEEDSPISHIMFYVDNIEQSCCCGAMIIATPKEGEPLEMVNVVLHDGDYNYVSYVQNNHSGKGLILKDKLVFFK